MNELNDNRNLPRDYNQHEIPFRELTRRAASKGLTDDLSVERPGKNETKIAVRPKKKKLNLKTEVSGLSLKTPRAELS